MRVLCLTPWFPNCPGDREGNYIFDSVMSLRDTGIEIKVLVSRPWKPWRSDGLVVDTFVNDLNIKLLEHVSIPRNYLRAISNRMLFWGLYQKVLDYARKERIELIHVHTEGLAEVASAVAMKTGIPTVVTIHGINMSRRYIGTHAQKERFRKALNRCDRVVLVGEPLRGFVRDLTGNDSHFRVVHNGFRLTGSVPVQRHLFGGGNIELISVSNLHEGKGIDLTIQALANFKQEGVANWRYTIVGDGAMRSELEILVRHCELTERVRFIGAVEHDEVAGYLSKADLFVLPSYREAFGVAYLEAMACGLLAIGVEGQGAAEFIRQGENGLLVEPKSVDSLTTQLRFAFTHPQESRQLAVVGQRTAAEKFNWGVHAKLLSSLYSEVVVENRKN